MTQMTKQFRPVFLALLFLFILNHGLGQSNARHTFIVPVNFIVDCEVGTGPCDPFTLTRMATQDSLILRLPSGGTMSSVQFYTAGIDSIHSGHAKANSPIYLEDNTSVGEGYLNLILTGLPDGEYWCQLLGCNLGGRFIVRIRTLFDCKSHTVNGSTVESTSALISSEYKGPNLNLVLSLIKNNLTSANTSVQSSSFPISKFYSTFYTDTTGRLVQVCVDYGKERIPLLDMEQNFQKILDQKPFYIEPAKKNGKSVSSYFIVPVTVHYE